MAIHKYGDITPIQQEYASKQFLKVYQPLAVTQRFAQAESLPKKNTQTMKWKRYLNLDVTTAAVSEGITPESQKLKTEVVTAVLKQYIYVLELTDVISDTHTDPILNIMVTRIGEAMANTIELITIEVLKSGTNVYYANNVASRSAVNNKISRGDLRNIVRGFDRALARPFTEIIAPTAKVSTHGVEAAFYAMAHTDLEPDIRDMTGFIPVVEYSSVERRTPGEIGACERIRFVLSPNFKPWEKAGTSGTTFLSGGIPVTAADNADVYPVIVVGRDAYASVRLQGRGAVETYVLNPGQARGGDPAAQRGSVANKVWYTAVILNQVWMARLEVACTANAS